MTAGFATLGARLSPMRAASGAAGVAVVATALVFLGHAGVSAQEPLTVLVDRAAAYVDDYHAKLAMVVAQERYTQEVRYPAPPMSRTRDMTSKTVLTSDFLLVRSPRGGAWLPFRDVFERDGVTVRDRQERLSALFIENSGTAFELAARIADESSRYNLGNIDRNINVPTLALEFLTPAHRERFSFELEGASSDGVQVIRYQESRGPTYIKTTNDRDLPVSGRYWIREATGRVERSELRASDNALDALISVVYRADEQAGLWVPGRMDEEYAQKNDRSEIRGTAVYTRYRRFQVTTSDQLAP